MSEKPNRSLTRRGKVLLAGVVGAAFVLGYALRRPPATTAVVPESQSQAAGVEQKTAQVWTCAMHPQIPRSGPGLCPICSMELVPVTAEAPAAAVQGMRVFTATAEAAALMDIRTAPVQKRPIEIAVRMVGKVDYDETRVRHITAWVGGRIDRLYVDFTGVTVEKGAPMAYLYSPALLAAQQELLQAVSAEASLAASDVEILKETSAGTVKSAREKLRLVGLSAEQVAEIEKRGTPSEHVTIDSPLAGTVIEKNAVEGMYVDTGMTIYTVADLAEVWVMMEAYESDLEWIAKGQEITFTTESLPGETFKGTVAFIDPFLNQMTRSVRVRVNAPNPQGKLKPGTFVQAVLRVGADGGREAPLVIPASAPLVTGTRAVVYVEVPGADTPTFEGREIVLGPRAGDFYVVRHGLREGELVVTSGNFKIDSALQIEAKPSMMSPEGGAMPAHEHAGMAMEGSHAQHAGGAQAPGPVPTVPAVFADGLRDLLSAFAEVSSSMGTAETAAVRRSFSAFSEALAAVDAGGLDGHALVMWRELRMGIDNDAFEGREARDLEEARRAYMSLEKNVKRLREQFPAAHEPGTQAAKAPEAAPAQFHEQLAALWADYLALSKALAGDDFAGAIAALGRSKASLSAVDMSLLEGDAHVAWMDVLPALSASIDSASPAADIEGVRAQLDALSRALAKALRQLGVGESGPVYLIRCPMASEGKGAAWLQADREIRNPYFGKAMPECGEIMETIGAGPPAAEHRHD